MSKVNPSLEDVRARRRQLADEDRELAAIEAGLVKLADLLAARAIEPAAVRAAPPVIVPPVVSPPRRQMTKKEMIIEALDQPRALWQSAKDVQAYVSRLAGNLVPMSSISPALTDMKNAETLVRRDMFVALALRVETEEPGFLKENGEATASPDTGEPDRSPIETHPSASAGE